MITTVGFKTPAQRLSRTTRYKMSGSSHADPVVDACQSSPLASAFNVFTMPARRPEKERNADFIRRFTQREEERRIAKRPAALTADQRAALRKQLEGTQFLKPDYADNTKINIAGILRKWKRYCEFIKLGGTWRDVI
ncbi:hypothetical protein VTK26DRAFT_5875 [Humicola hyalothermophila]